MIPVFIPCTQLLNTELKVIILDWWCAYLFWLSSPLACLHYIFFFNIIKDICILHIEKFPFLAYSSMRCWKCKKCVQSTPQTGWRTPATHQRLPHAATLCSELPSPHPSQPSLCCFHLSACFHFIMAFYSVLPKILLAITRVKIPNGWQ